LRFRLRCVDDRIPISNALIVDKSQCAPRGTPANICIYLVSSHNVAVTYLLSAHCLAYFFSLLLRSLTQRAAANMT